MTAIIWSPQSLRDLKGIRAYVAQDSPGYAEFVVQRVVASVERLEAFPESGRAVPELDRPEIREVIVRPYRVVYRYRAEPWRLPPCSALHAKSRRLRRSGRTRA